MEGDDSIVARTPLELRPLSLKNIDNKIVAGIAARPFRETTTAGVVEQQKGFVAKRQFTEHPVSLESAGLRLALHPGSFLPILGFL